MSQSVRQPRRSRQQWRDLKQEWEASGESQPAFASRHGLNLHTFKWWCRQLRKDSVAGDPARVDLVGLVPGQQVANADAGTRRDGLQLSLGAHTVLCLSSTASPVRAALLVAALLWAH